MVQHWGECQESGVEIWTSPKSLLNVRASLGLCRMALWYLLAGIIPQGLMTPGVWRTWHLLPAKRVLLGCTDNSACKLANQQRALWPSPGRSLPCWAGGHPFRCGCHWSRGPPGPGVGAATCSACAVLAGTTFQGVAAHSSISQRHLANWSKCMFWI